jgi:predicted DNA-binding transcriptional regulator AlpA
MSELLTLDDLAKMLKLSKTSAYNLTRARTRARMKHPVPMLRINGHSRFVSTDVEAWLKQLREEGEAA